MKHILQRFFAFAVTLLFHVGIVSARDSLPPVYLITTDTLLEYTFTTEQYQMLPDKTRTLTIDQMTTQPVASQFFSRSNKPTGVDTLVNVFWFRYRVKNTLSKKLNIALDSWAEKSDFFVVRSNNSQTHFHNGYNVSWADRDGFSPNNVAPFFLEAGEEVIIYYRIESKAIGIPTRFKIDLLNTEKYALEQYTLTQNRIPEDLLEFTMFAGFCLLGGLFNLCFYIIDKQKVYLYFSIFLFALAFVTSPFYQVTLKRHYPGSVTLFNIAIGSIWTISFIQFIRYYFQTFIYTRKWDKFLIALSVMPVVAGFIVYYGVGGALSDFTSPASLLIGCLGTIFVFFRLKHKTAKTFSIAISPFILGMLFSIVFGMFQQRGITLPEFLNTSLNLYLNLSIGWAVLYFTWILFKQYDKQKKEITQIALQKERLEKEKEMERRELIEQQKIDLEFKVEQRTGELKKSLEELRTTQQQLIQSEKMASLGELTAGIAHEIQNPLNFVNNFSEVSNELVDEMNEELTRGDIKEVKAIATDIKQNLQKIAHHGKRADAIVKGMLQHSRKSSDKKEPTDINALVDEYLRLAYHGLRAKDNSFNATLKTEYDGTIGRINIIPQDIGRVILNLVNNAMYAVDEKKKQTSTDYEPTVTVSSKKTGDKIEVSIADNGNGIPQNIIDKIFQPFFTTKPTGQGTGLGLSLAYDIVKAHGGELKVETKEGEGTTLTIQMRG